LRREEFVQCHCERRRARSVLDASGAFDVDSAFVEVVESVELGNVIAHRRGLRI
jgi:hypothetical protein